MTFSPKICFPCGIKGVKQKFILIFRLQSQPYKKFPMHVNKSRIFALHADEEIIRKCDYRTVIPYQF